MNENENNPDLQTWIDPALEARIVAWVSKEASAFEADELRRLLKEKPELEVFTRRIKAVHGLVAAANKPDAEPMRLSDSRRRMLLERLGRKETADAESPAAIPLRPQSRGWHVSSRFVLGLAACLIIGLVAAGLFFPAGSAVKESAKSRRTAEPLFANRDVVDLVVPSSQFQPTPPPLAAPSAPDAGPSKFRENVEQVKKLATEAQSFYDTGRFDLALKRSEQILNVDPYNTAARKLQEEINEKRDQHAIAGYNHTRSHMQWQVEKAWDRPVRYFGSGGASLVEGEGGSGQDGASQLPLGMKDDASILAKKLEQKPGDGDRDRSDHYGLVAKERDPGARSSTSGPDTSGPVVPGTPAPTAAEPVTWPKEEAERKAAQLTADETGIANFHFFDDRSGTPAPAQPASGTLPAVEEKLKRIVIPKLELKNATVSEALDVLRRKSAELDHEGGTPASRGVNIAAEIAEGAEASSGPLSGEASAESNTGKAADARITLNLEKIPLGEALRYVAGLANLRTKVDAEGVKVVPVTEVSESMVTKEFTVPEAGLQGKDVRRALEDLGVTFPPGASAILLPGSRRLVVRNTRENLDLIAERIPAGLQPLQPSTPPAVANNETKAAEEPFSTFSLHVSDVSFRLAQAALAKGEMPDVESIRPEEFYNAFDYGDPSPAAGEKVGCQIEQSAHPFLQQRNLVRIAMKVPATGRAKSQPLRLTLLLDTSGSMEREDRAASVRRAVEVLATLLGPEDRVNLVGFSRQPRLLAEDMRADEPGKLVEAIASTPMEGGTNLEEALKLGSELALRHRLPSAQNRIVLLTDGAANLGNANAAQLGAMIEKLRQQGVAFDACGVGADGLNDEILEALTRKGDGRYYVLDRPEDADTGFARQLAGAFRPAAQNVKVQVRFNAARVGGYRLIGFEKHRLKKEDFRDDKVDAAELAAEEAAVALYQVEVLPEGEGELGEVFVRFLDPSDGRAVEQSWTITYDPQARAFDEATPSIQLAGTAAFLAEKLLGGANAASVELDKLAPIVSRISGHFSGQARVQQLAQMFEQMRRMTPKQ